MEQPLPDAAERLACQLPARRIWPWVLLGLLTWQGWMASCLLGGWALFDERPILSGFHPQHLYLGTLGARALCATGRSCCIDPAFQAAYPKTPVFNGSRLAEVFLFLSGGTYRPVAYKLGLALWCLAVPWLLIVAARGAGLDWPTTIVATTAGLVVWWSPTSEGAVVAGSSELLLGSLAVLANVGLLVRFHMQPSVLSWLGLVVTAWLGWFAQPMLFPIALPLFLIFYLHVGHKHGSVSWHLGLLAAEALSLGLSATWLIDWVTFWWLRHPPIAADILTHRTLHTIWNAPVWGGQVDRVFGLLVLASAAVGVLILPRCQRATARLLGLGSTGLFVLALLGVSWEPLGNLGTAGLLTPSLWFASLPAAHAWTVGFRRLRALVGTRQILATLAVLVGIGGVCCGDNLRPFLSRFVSVTPFEYELGPDREALVEALKSRTGPEARILWEDMPQPRTAPHWTPLLPLLSGRSFVGGLDPDATIEHATIGFADQNLAGTHISQWSDQALEDYCTQYNIGWAVCFSPSAVKRFGDWLAAEKIQAVSDHVPGMLFQIKKSPGGYALRGQAKMLHADSHHITLGDVVPDNGVVVLSLHYQAGMRASPSRVQLEREPIGVLDPIGFLRLRVAGPVARVTITWSDR